MRQTICVCALPRRIAFALLVAAFASGVVEASATEDCPTSVDEIATDRPDVTNSSVVVPRGSFQGENGINWTRQRGSNVIDGTNTRLRLGFARCTEVLVDLPNYFRAIHGRSPSGFSNLAPAVKRQIGLLPGDVELSTTVGLSEPTGTTRIAGRGYGPYLQLPWSREIGGGWGISGMFTAFWFPSQPDRNPTLEPTLVVERQVGSRADLFLEYVGYFPHHGISSQLINSGGAYRITPRQQVDFHAGFGVNRSAPSYFFGLGYSFRFDDLF
jgi:Putative MetA-pathway of phenol degradation